MYNKLFLLLTLSVSLTISLALDSNKDPAKTNCVLQKKQIYYFKNKKK